MNGHGKSDSPVVPAKLPNNAGRPVAEVVEGRGLPEGNVDRSARPAHSGGTGVSQGLDRVRQAARSDKTMRFTALLHHVDVARLRAAYRAINPRAAVGVDQVTWQQYGQDLQANLEDLHGRVHRGSFRAAPSRRVYIPKSDGRLRPLGIASLEDKIVQRAVVEVLNAVYETDFVGFSYGFRPGRGPHDGLDALAVGLTRTKVNWVLDADIRSFFTEIDREWMLRFVEHRIADKRVLRLHPQVVGRRDHRGWQLVRRGQGHTARSVTFAAARQRVPTPRLRLVGQGVAEPACERRHDHRAVCR